MLEVRKYGGQCLSTPDDIKFIAKQLNEAHLNGSNLIVVVSAMGQTTNRLHELAQQVSSNPSERELDMLLTTGERVSMALLSMALHDLGVPAISFTGSQAGVMTQGSHSNANIKEVKPIRLEKELQANKVIVLAGFQGVDPQTKEITTLGRGGSDTTAVAMAAYFKAKACEIRKTVNGVYTADPNIVPDATLIENIDYESLSEMSRWGARVLHSKAADMAHLLKVPLKVMHVEGKSPFTTVGSKKAQTSGDSALAINHLKLTHDITCVSVTYPSAITDKERGRFNKLLADIDVTTQNLRESSQTLAVDVKDSEAEHLARILHFELIQPR